MNVETFIGFVVVVLLLALAYTLSVFRKPKYAKEYFKNTKPGKQAWGGILMFVGAALVLGGIAFVFSAKAHADDNWFTYGQVYLGAEHTTDLHSICDEGGVDEKVVSHGGLRMNIFRSDDRKFETNLKYTHHSCAFGGDNHVYDAFGFEASLFLWGD